MGEKLVVGPINKGIQTYRTPFNIDNDAFPRLINAYQWRGRIKRKRGTSLLGRLNLFIGTTDGSGNIIVTLSPTPIAQGISQFVIGDETFTDPGGSSPVTLLTTGAGSGSLNRSTGVLTITGSNAATSVYYYPGLPVMGLETFNDPALQYPASIAFDTDYAYNISTSSPYNINGVSFYNNPATGTYAGYTQKSTWTALNWNGQNYQQFWTTNYQGTLWATNGVPNPFAVTNIGMQYKAITGVVIDAAGPPALATLTIVAHGLVQGDFVFINEVGGVTGINFQTGYVVSANPQAANSVQVEFPNATLGGAYTSGGIAQYLTSNSDNTKDCIRWYNGDPTTGTGNPNATGKGWVNFCPPLSQASFSIGDLPAAQYYLVGAKAIFPFKDRLLFFGPVIQTSSANSQVYLQDTVVYSQNGTPYYTASFSTSDFHPILVPSNQTATAFAFFEDISGYGGFISAGYAQPITTVAPNEDVLIVGFTTRQTRFVYTGNDLIPFNFFVTNSEFGSSSTFSVVTLDRGVLTIGPNGIPISNQIGAQRIDLEIPDQIFQFNLTNNGPERVTAQRDFINEWVYFTYPSNERSYSFPNQTLQYNYRDNSWAIFDECFTTYGTFRPVTGYTWATIGTKFPTWSSWNEPWNAGSSTLLQPKVIGGNQQGFVLFREEGTNEGTSLYIQNIGANSTITSPNHCLNNDDYITISGVQGTVGSQVNGLIFSVTNTTTNTFQLLPNITGGTYLGGGLIKRMYRPFIQTKQFPVSWGMTRKTRIGNQQYLLSTTDNAQITLLIYLSQDGDNAYNAGPIIPDPNSQNNGLIYSTVLYTCPESANLGLTSANTNLQMISVINSDGTNASSPQAQIWHRVNTSLIGDTVQLGFTLNDTQMQDTTFTNQFAEIELHAIIIDVTPSQTLA